jgi:hypothetical protein
MAQHSLYAYAIGLELEAIASPLVASVNTFISKRSWICPDVWAVDQQLNSEDWNLGLNLLLPDPYSEPPGWFADVEAIVQFCLELRREFRHDFVVGIADNRTGCGEDIIEVNSDQPDYEYLRRFIGTKPPTC